MARILLVDDTPEQLAAYQRLLRDRFDIVTATSGAAALDLLARDQAIDVIVSDMCMPCMNGIEFLEKAAGVLPSATRIMLTGHADLNTTIEAINRGRVFRYLQKPCSKEELTEAIEAALATQIPSTASLPDGTSTPAGGAWSDEDRLVADLRSSLDQGLIQPHFQPIVDLRTALIEGAEALARWPHPRDGWIPPALFIPKAEQHGLMPRLGQSILEAACAEADVWANLGFEGSISVNISTVQFSGCDIVQTIREALRASGVAPDRLTIEITETVLIDDPKSIIDRLQTLREEGIKIAIDDFGTGYSSLAYLKHLPVDRLKIDRCFIDEIDCDDRSRAFVQAMLDLARKIDLVVVAEGVERPMQREILASMGCDLGQGYLFDKPLSAERFREAIAAQGTTQLVSAL